MKDALELFNSQGNIYNCLNKIENEILNNVKFY